MATPTPVMFCGQALDTTQLALIQQCVERYSQLSREELAATVCEWMQWQRPNGGLKTRECRDLLQHLQNQGLLTLPVLRAGRPRGSATVIPQTAQGDPYAPIQMDLSEVQPLRLQRVEQPAER